MWPLQYESFNQRKNSKIPLSNNVSNSIFPRFCPHGHFMENSGHLANYHLPYFVHIVNEYSNTILLDSQFINFCTYIHLSQKNSKSKLTLIKQLSCTFYFYIGTYMQYQLMLLQSSIGSRLFLRKTLECFSDIQLPRGCCELKTLQSYTQ